MYYQKREGYPIHRWKEGDYSFCSFFIVGYVEVAAPKFGDRVCRRCEEEYLSEIFQAADQLKKISA